jgi:voltage-gated potassium channel
MNDAAPPKVSYPKNLRDLIYVVIFGTDTPAGKAFDVFLLWTIVLSVAAVLLESVDAIRLRFGPELSGLEWLFTVLFTLEYSVRLYCLRERGTYVRSFFGVIDLLSILPTYVSLIWPGTQALAVIRVFRILRLFRVFKLFRYMREARILSVALRKSKPKIVVFVTALGGIVVTMGALMYLVEGEEAGFTSIPKSIYWAVITVTTVGYGDLVPQSVMGQAIATLAMVLGYAIIAVPTGIVSLELSQAVLKPESIECRACRFSGHDPDAGFCKRCGGKLA